MMSFQRFSKLNSKHLVTLVRYASSKSTLHARDEVGCFVKEYLFGNITVFTLTLVSDDIS